MRNSNIRIFEHNGEYYRHEINLDDDSVSLFAVGGDKLLTYDCSSVARKPDGEIIGRFRLEENRWVFHYENSSETFAGLPFALAEGLLDSEVEVSCLYLDKQSLAH